MLELLDELSTFVNIYSKCTCLTSPIIWYNLLPAFH